MSPKMDYRQRKDLVLEIVVDEYIHTVSPVSSNFIASHHHLDLSPATIRNILAELEENGYLTHPHTSAGRIPTQLGYRYFVDHLMHEISLLEEEKQRIKSEYTEGIKELGKLLEKTTQVLSEVTQYTSIISIDGQPDKVFYRGASFVVQYPELQDLKKIKNVLQALEEKEHILEILNRNLAKKIEIYIGHETSCKEIEGCSLAVVRYETDKGLSGRMAVLGPTSMDYKKVVSTLNYVSKLVHEIF